MRKLISAALTSALILLSPGLPAYQAAAQTLGSSSSAGRAPAANMRIGNAGPRFASDRFTSSSVLIRSSVLPGGSAPRVMSQKETESLTLVQPETAPMETPAAIAPATEEKRSFLGQVLRVFTPAIVSSDGTAASSDKSKEAARESSNPGVVLERLYDGGRLKTHVEMEGLSRTPVSHAAGSRQGLSRKSAQVDAIIEDHHIPTPEAARRVGEIRRETKNSKWVTAAAVGSLAAAGVAAAVYGAVPVLTLGLGLVFSVLAHEVGHIAMLRLLGDKTSEHAGSHSLNPFHHIHPVKTVLLPALSLALSTPFGVPLLIGSAKPVDADFNNLRSPLSGKRSARNAFWVAAMGPATNLLLAGLAYAAFLAFPPAGTAAAIALGLAKMNLALAAFNALIPLPQLDGGKMLASVLPERFYAKWVYNPNVEKNYQGMFRRLYEGPAMALSFLANRMGIKSTRNVNLFANGVTFAALAAFYAVAYMHFSVAVPLLFLALPCSYDYWCIREKVRSEAAVQDLMKIMSRWGSVIKQISEDLGVQSEVSSYEAEHAMKNALETVIDELMAKPEFKALSEEAKTAELMRVYPEVAAKFLKDKVMTEDDMETILKVLRDGRNNPFYEEVKSWIKDHEVFKKWGSPHARKKLKDAIQDEGAKREKSAGGALTLPAASHSNKLLEGTVPQSGASAGLPDMRHAAVVMGGQAQESFSLGGVEVLDQAAGHALLRASHLLPTPHVIGEIAEGSPAGESQEPGKLHVEPSVQENETRILFAEGTTEAQAGEIYARLGAEDKNYDDGRMGIDAVVTWRNGEQAQIKALEFAREALVARVGVKAMTTRQLALPLAAQDAPELSETQALGKIRIEPGLLNSQTKIAFVEGVTLEQANAVYAIHDVEFMVEGDISPRRYDTPEWRDGMRAIRKAIAFALEPSVESVGVSPAIARQMRLSTPAPAEPVETAPAPAVDPAVQAPEPTPVAEPVAVVEPAKPVFDADRALLIRFKPATDEKAVLNFAATRSLRLVDPEYRGGENLALFEVRSGIDVDWILETIREEISEQGAILVAASLLKEKAVGAETAPPRVRPDANPEGAQHGSAAALPRDSLVEWQNYLNERLLNDGKSHLTPEQVQLLLRFLKPVNYKPDAPVAPVVAVNDILSEILPVLLSPRGGRNSVFLLGAAGTGKTAIAEAVAQLRDQVQDPGDKKLSYLDIERLKGRWIIDFNIDELLSPGQDEDPMQLFKAVLGLVQRLNGTDAQRGNEVILLFDEVHKLFMDPVGRKIANYLKAPLRDGRVSLLATTTEKEFKEFIEKDDAFMERAVVKRIEEPGVEKTLKMLRGIKAFLEKLHGTVMPDDTLVSTAKLTHQFVKDHANPRKSVNALKEAAELARPDNLRLALALEIAETWRKAGETLREAGDVLKQKGINSSLALPIELYNRLANMTADIVRLYEERSKVQDGLSTTTPDIIKRVIAKWTGIASGQLSLGEEDSSRYVEMDKVMGKEIINQDRAVAAIANAIRRNKAGLSATEGPMGKFLFVGPTGVGKTYLAKKLAEFLFKDPEAMIRIDMSEYMDKHVAARLTGSPPGYVGHDEGGQLTEAVRRRPYSVILFDEIEKAHPDVFNVLLQVLDDGRLTDGKGRTVDFKNTVILLSSNVGMEAVDSEKYEKMLASETDPTRRAEIEKLWDEEIQLAIREGILSKFRPEFINRLDEDPMSKAKWITFNRLKVEHAAAIATLELKKYVMLLQDRHDIELLVAPAVVELLQVEGFSALYGARPMKAAIQKLIIDPMARWILTQAAEGNKDVRGTRIEVGASEGQVTFTMSRRPEIVPERASVAGTAETLTQKLLELLNAPAEAPRNWDEAELNSILEGILSGSKKTAVPEKPAGVFHQGALELPVEAKMVQAQHNKPNGKDDSMRYELRTILETAAARQWSPEMLAALDVPPGEVGVGWIRHFIRHAKDAATKSGVSQPIGIQSQVDADFIRVIIHSEHEMTDQEASALTAHLTGVPPASYQDAQAKADNLNLTSAMVYDHNLWDLYRRLSALPGARVGLARGTQAQGGRGTDYWIELSKDGPEIQSAPAPIALTPHRRAEMKKTQEIFLHMILQSEVSESQQDGPGVKAAAAEGFGMLSQSEDIKLARRWIRDNGWANTDSGEKMFDQWPLVMAASLVMERYGEKSDIQTMEAVLRRWKNKTAHMYMPPRRTLLRTLAVLYQRAGVAEIKKALERNDPKDFPDITEAALIALGEVGPVDGLKKLVDVPQAYARMLERAPQGELDDFILDHWPPPPTRDSSYESTAWKTYPTEKKQALLKLVGTRAARPLKDLRVLAHMLAGRFDNDRPTGYAAAVAWAEIVARGNYTKTLTRDIEDYLDKNSLTSYNSTDSWGVLLAFVYALERVGGRENLAALEEIMKANPGQVQAAHEQAFFSAPYSWAKTIVRNGLFAALSRPQMGENGVEKPSKITEMLTSHNPMFATAAIYALALAQAQLASEAPISAAEQEAQAYPEFPSSARSSGGYGGI